MISPAMITRRHITFVLQTFAVSNKRALTPVDEKLAFLIGYRTDLSFYDVHTANQLYRCSSKFHQMFTDTLIMTTIS